MWDTWCVRVCMLELTKQATTACLCALLHTCMNVARLLRWQVHRGIDRTATGIMLHDLDPAATLAKAAGKPAKPSVDVHDGAAVRTPETVGAFSSAGRCVHVTVSRARTLNQCVTLVEPC